MVEHLPHVFQSVFVRRRIFASQTEDEGNEHEYEEYLIRIRIRAGCANFTEKTGGQSYQVPGTVGGPI